MNWALRFGFGKGVVLINASLVCLESLPNFHDEDLATFHLSFMIEIWQCFASSASQHIKHYSHQAFIVRIWQWRCPIFTVKIRQSFVFGVLQCISRVSCLCVWCMPTCSCQDLLKPLKASSILMRVAYMGKPMSLSDMNRDDHALMIMHTIQREYAPTTIALGTYLLYKVKSTRDQRGSLTQPQESIIQSAQSPTYKHIHIHTSCTMLSHREEK